MSNIGSYPFAIRSTDADWQDRLQPEALFAFMQDAAYRHAEALQLGANDLDTRGLCWILVRVSARFARLPRWGETMRIDTWHRGVKRLIFTRDYAFFDQAGDQFGYATSDWLVADQRTHRPQKPDAVFPGCYDLPGGTSAYPAGEAATRLQPLEANQPSGPWHTVQADYCDIDRNGHVNNTRYVTWCLNAVYERLATEATSSGTAFARIEDLPRRQLAGIDIQFISEVFLGTVIHCFGTSDKDSRSYSLEARKESSQEAIFRARILFQP